MFLCECGYAGFCGKTMPVEVYDILKREEDEDLYIVYKDHIEDEQEIQREGEWLLVRVIHRAVSEGRG